LRGRELLGACQIQARGDTGPLKKIQLHLAMNPSMAAFEAVKAARTPQLWGRRWVRESFSPKNQNNTRKPLALAISPWRLEFVIFLYFEGMSYDKFIEYGCKQSQPSIKKC
jgi:hypothetical protein